MQKTTRKKEEEVTYLDGWYFEPSLRELTRLCVRGGERSSPVPNKPYGLCGR